MNHRDRLNAIKAKKAPAEFADEEASRIEALLAADQQKELEQPAYREAPKGDSHD